MAFSPDGRFVVTGSADRTARQWATTTGKPVGPALTHAAATVRAVALSPDGLTILTAADSPKLWKVPPPMPGKPDQLALWARALTGLKRDRFGGIAVLDAREWLDARLADSQRPGRPASPPDEGDPN